MKPVCRPDRAAFLIRAGVARCVVPTTTAMRN